jgi:LEA14-like dessication related protein
MKIYNPHKTTITLNGITYKADESGIIDIPDNKMNDSVWGQGFVSAKGRIAELSTQEVDNNLESVPAVIADKANTKPTN